MSIFFYFLGNSATKPSRPPSENRQTCSSTKGVFQPKEFMGQIPAPAYHQQLRFSQELLLESDLPGKIYSTVTALNPGDVNMNASAR